MALTKREKVYDEAIAPLVARVIAICKEHDIPMVFSAQLNDDREHTTDEDGELGAYFCTTILTAKGAAETFGHTHEKLLSAARSLCPEAAPQWAAYTVTDGVAERTCGSDGYDPGPG